MKITVNTQVIIDTETKEMTVLVPYRLDDVVETEVDWGEISEARAAELLSAALSAMYAHRSVKIVDDDPELIPLPDGELLGADQFAD